VIRFALVAALALAACAVPDDAEAATGAPSEAPPAPVDKIDGIAIGSELRHRGRKRTVVRFGDKPAVEVDPIERVKGKTQKRYEVEFTTTLPEGLTISPEDRKLLEEWAAANQRDLRDRTILQKTTVSAGNGQPPLKGAYPEIQGVHRRYYLCGEFKLRVCAGNRKNPGAFHSTVIGQLAYRFYDLLT
jgi:hypothetical protein